MIDDEISYKCARKRMGWCPKSIGDEVACYQGYLERDDERGGSEDSQTYYFVLHPAKQLWRFSSKDEKWRKLKKPGRLDETSLKVSEKYAKCIDVEPEGQVLNSSQRDR